MFFTFVCICSISISSIVNLFMRIFASLEHQVTKVCFQSIILFRLKNIKQPRQYAYFFFFKKGLIVQTIYDVTGQSICWLLLSYNFGCMMYFPRKYPIKDIDNSGRNFKLWEKTNLISYVFALVNLYMSVHYIYVIFLPVYLNEPINWSSIKFFARSRTRAIKSSCLHLTIHFIVKQKKCQLKVCNYHTTCVVKF